MKNWNQISIRVLYFLVIIGLIFLFTKECKAQEWHITNQVTVAWDAVMTLENGEPLSESIFYKVYRKIAGTEELELLTPDPISETQYTINFQVEGSYFIGVNAVRNVEGQEMESDIAWSNDPIATGGNPFGIRHYILPAKPTNLIKQ